LVEFLVDEGGDGGGQGLGAEFASDRFAGQ
jgi:hypothetical protein